MGYFRYSLIVPLRTAMKALCGTFTTPDIPDDSLFIEPTFGAPCEQGDGDCIWWDDVTVEKLWEASPRLP